MSISIWIASISIISLSDFALVVSHFRISTSSAKCMNNYRRALGLDWTFVYGSRHKLIFSCHENAIVWTCGVTKRPRKKLCDKHLNVMSLNTMKRLKKYPEGWKGNHCESCTRPKAETVEDKIWKYPHAFAIWNSLHLVESLHLL